MSAHKLGLMENNQSNNYNNAILRVLNKLDIQTEIIEELNRNKINLITSNDQELLEQINESKDKQEKIIKTFKDFNEKLDEVKKTVRRHVNRGVQDLEELLQKKSFMLEFVGRSDLQFQKALDCKNCEIALVEFEASFDKKVLEANFYLNIITNTFINGEESERFFTWKKDINSPITDRLIEQEGVTKLKLQPNKLIYFPIKERIEFIDFILTDHEKTRIGLFNLKLKLHIKN